MKFLIFLIKWGFPFLVFTDLGSQLFEISALLNVSRSIRIIMLVLFFIETFKHIKIARKFKFFNYFFWFNVILFFYLFTDRDFFEGLWIYFKILFWGLGLNVLFIYQYLGFFTLNDYHQVVKRVVIAAFLMTILFVFTGFIDEEYNIAAYLALYLYPTILLFSDNYRKNILYMALIAFTIVITFKRGALLGFGLVNIVYFLGVLRNQFTFKLLMKGVFIVAFFVFAGIYVFETRENALDERFSEEQFDPNNKRAGSGRVGAYTGLFEGWYNSDSQIFGLGNQEDSRRLSFKRVYAHSDILGFLYNYGLVGILLIVVMYIKIISFRNYVRKFDKNNAVLISSIFIILIINNMFSELYKSTDALYLFALFPYFQFKYSKKNLSQNTTQG